MKDRRVQGSKDECTDCREISTGIKYRLINRVTNDEASSLYYWCKSHYDHFNKSYKHIAVDEHVCKLVCKCDPREALLF